MPYTTSDAVYWQHHHERRPTMDIRCGGYQCRKRATWTWRENDIERPYCPGHFVDALETLVESRDGAVEWVVPRLDSAHKGSRLLGMLTVTS